MSDTQAPVQGANAPVQAEDANTAQQAPATNPQMEAFARKERQLRKMQMDLQAEKARIEQEAAKYKTDYLPKSRLQEDPMAVLSELGYDRNKLSELLLNEPDVNDPVVRRFQSKIQAMEQKIADAERRQQEATAQQYEQAKKQIATEASLLIDSDPEFQTIKEAGAADAVTELIISEFNETGVLMNVREAAMKVEEYLVEEASKLARLSKIQQKLAPTQAPQKQAETSQQQGLKTLTQNLTTGNAPKKLTDAERRARAMLAFQGKLNE